MKVIFYGLAQNHQAPEFSETDERSGDSWLYGKCVRVRRH